MYLLTRKKKTLEVILECFGWSRPSKVRHDKLCKAPRCPSRFFKLPLVSVMVEICCIPTCFGVFPNQPVLWQVAQQDSCYTVGGFSLQKTPRISLGIVTVWPFVAESCWICHFFSSIQTPAISVVQLCEKRQGAKAQNKSVNAPCRHTAVYDVVTSKTLHVVV